MFLKLIVDYFFKACSGDSLWLLDMILGSVALILADSSVDAAYARYFTDRKWTAAVGIIYVRLILFF